MLQRIGKVVCITVSLALWVSPALAQTPYYKGKAITIVAGTKAGDVYDLYARHFAQFLPKYIPGNPNIIVQNMAGAGSMIAANFVYNVANPDGLTLGAIFPALYFDQVVGRPEVKYDWTQFAWIGSPVTSNHLLYMRADSPYQTINHVVKASPPAKCGATGTSSTAYYIPKLLDEVIGTNFDVILGYQAGQDIDLAVERNEVVCRAFTLTAFFAREPFRTWRKNRFVRVLVQTGRKRDARIKDVPTIYELMDQYKTSESNRRLANVLLGGAEFGRFMLVAPGTPPDRVKTLREAYVRAMKDPELIAEAKKGRMDMDPSTGEELQALLQEIMDQPPDVIERMKKILSE